MKTEEQQKTIATKVSSTLAAEVEKRAQEEMLSVACYVRRLLAQAVRGQEHIAA